MAGKELELILKDTSSAKTNLADAIEKTKNSIRSKKQIEERMKELRSQIASAAAESDAIMKKCSTLPFLAMSDVAIEEAGFTEDQQERLKSERDRYLSRQAVSQAAQAAGLDLSGGQRAGEAS